MSKPQALLDGLAFGESPRWHDSHLWFADWGVRRSLPPTSARRCSLLRAPGRTNRRRDPARCSR
jgi:hypothetical protein